MIAFEHKTLLRQWITECKMKEAFVSRASKLLPAKIGTLNVELRPRREKVGSLTNGQGPKGVNSHETLPFDGAWGKSSKEVCCLCEEVKIC